MITRRKALAALGAAFVPFVNRKALLAPISPPGKRPPPGQKPMQVIDVILYQNADDDPVIQIVNPDGTCPDVTKITSAKLTVKDVNYGSAVLPDKTMSSGISFATDPGGGWVNATIHYTPTEMSSLLGSLTQPKTGCVGNLNMTVTMTGGSQIGTIPLRVAIYPNATSGG